MVGDVYSDIKISQLSSMLGLDTEQTIAAATSEGSWVLSNFIISDNNSFRLDSWHRQRLHQAKSSPREEQDQQQ